MRAGNRTANHGGHSARSDDVDSFDPGLNLLLLELARRQMFVCVRHDLAHICIAADPNKKQLRDHHRLDALDIFDLLLGVVHVRLHALCQVSLLGWIQKPSVVRLPYRSRFH